MPENRYCILCGKEIQSENPDVVFCSEHGGPSQTEASVRQPQETTWEAEEENVQPLKDIAASWQPGQTLLDTFEVIGKLGEGGMGLVYRVHHKSWNMDLAVKQPKASLFATQKGKEGFIREAETWVDLGLHPHITSCYYVRTIADIPHIFVEFMEGGSLEDWIQQKKHDLYEGGPETSLERILDIAIQFAWGLAYAHEQGLVHQDVKPLNVLMTPEGVVKVTDFGLAKARAKAGESADKKDERALVSGSLHTVAYRSPEQAKGELLSHKTDIWSWAVSVLEMFEGGVFWYDGQSAGTSLDIFLGRKGESYLPLMPARLIDLLREGFQEDPGARPQDMLEIANRLTDIYENEIGEPYSRQQPEPAELRADSLNNKALSLLDLRKPEVAQDLLEQALSVDNQHVEATYNLGLLRWRSGQEADVDILKKLGQIQQNQPGDGRVAAALGWACMELGRFSEALAHFERSERLGGDLTSAEGARLALPLTERGASGAMRTFEGHTNWVLAVAFSPNGREILSGSGEGTLKLWDLRSGTCLRTLEGHTGPVTSIAFSPDGSLAFSGSKDKTLKLWDIEESVCMRSYNKKIWIGLVTFNPEKHLALSVSFPRTLKLWNLTKGKCLRTFKGFTDNVYAIAISPDGRQALSGHDLGSLRLWDLAGGACLRTIAAHTTGVTSVAFSPDGCQALSGSILGVLKLWDLATGTCLRTLSGHSHHVTSVIFSPEGHWALSGSNDRTLKLWDLARGTCLTTFEGHTLGILSIAVSPDGRQALSGSHDGSLKLWDLAGVKQCHYPAPFRFARGLAGSEAIRRAQTHAAFIAQGRQLVSQQKIAKALDALESAWKVPGFERASATLALSASVGARSQIRGFREGWLTRTFDGHSEAVASIAFSPDGRLAISGSSDRTLKLWDLETGACLRTLEGHARKLFCVAISPNGRYALSGSWDDTLKLWDLHSGACLRTLEGHESGVNAVAFSPDGRWALSGCYRSFKLWDLAAGVCVRRSIGLIQGVNSVAYSPDGRLALSGSNNKTLQLWDLAKSACLFTFKGYQGSVDSVAFSPDGRLALSGSSDKTLKLWDLSGGVCLQTFEGHNRLVKSVAFSPEGRCALSASGDQTLKLWDLATGACLRTFEGHMGYVNSVAISPNGRQALSASDDSSLKLWNLEWHYEFPGWADWDEGARPYLETFLTLHTPYAAQLPKKRPPIKDDIAIALTHRGQPSWTEADFQGLLTELGQRGFGWLRPEGVRRKLQELAGK